MLYDEFVLCINEIVPITPKGMNEMVTIELILIIFRDRIDLSIITIYFL